MDFEDKARDLHTLFIDTVLKHGLKRSGPAFRKGLVAELKAAHSLGSLTGRLSPIDDDEDEDDEE